ncbi:isoprenylcysteine carboxylmethyltransferase family protein [Anaeromyxobacter paludicola]|uniref:Isoprenylcysteine carboxyl methyltransferase n=1 Tax=Anaeromyxobacter paludicola TaxID=2918171 RepID=A0ABM7XE34_9BACT|nr:isoprenylcysteine carboxylmethyltransferase family protein [Anaeromyxobacter paludicola]BDG10134.1 hypothetical protein AMPC_32470 [Anaeromyxobacter paludicola]
MVNNALPGMVLASAVAAERGVELWLSARNARRLRRAGAVEAGRAHYPAMVAFHAALLAACLAWPLLGGERPRLAVAIPAVVAVLLAQALRWWAVATLGGRWTTRVLVLPGAPPVTGGPYRFFHHPNYLAVAVEVAALPLSVGAWIVALAATLLNAALMAVRIPEEERALGPAWAEAFAGAEPVAAPRAAPPQPSPPERGGGAPGGLEDGGSPRAPLPLSRGAGDGQGGGGGG